MALILAVNPGGTQSGTLARVARELQEHELIGADSCAVAITALADHKPVLVLLPAASPLGEPELLERLRTLVRGGIPTLRLPPPTSVNPKALADQIRQAVGEAPPPPVEEPAAEEPSEHLVTAAKVAISWIRARRATWAPVAAATPAQAPFVADAASSSESSDAELSLAEGDGPAAAGALEWRATLVTWLPRAAIIAAVVVAIWATMSCWPKP
jgi:hypothetical protein